MTSGPELVAVHITNLVVPIASVICSLNRLYLQELIY